MAGSNTPQNISDLKILKIIEMRHVHDPSISDLILEENKERNVKHCQHCFRVSSAPSRRTSLFQRFVVRD